jgi:hypothetical protein
MHAAVTTVFGVSRTLQSEEKMAEAYINQHRL